MRCRTLHVSTVCLAVPATLQFRGSMKLGTSSVPRASGCLRRSASPRTRNSNSVIILPPAYKRGYDTQVTNQPNGAAVANVINNVPGPRTTTNALSFQEFTLYPLTGSWGKYFGSLAELSTSPEDGFEIGGRQSHSVCVPALGPG